MDTLVQILTVAAVRRRAMHQLAAAGVAVGAAAVALVWWLALQH
jgi:hypothetical protein